MYGHKKALPLSICAIVKVSKVVYVSFIPPTLTDFHIFTSLRTHHFLLSSTLIHLHRREVFKGVKLNGKSLWPSTRFSDVFNFSSPRQPPVHELSAPSQRLQMQLITNDLCPWPSLVICKPQLPPVNSSLFNDLFLSTYLWRFLRHRIQP